MATAAATAGLLVLILDMDTQQNSTNWRRRRPDDIPLPLVQFTTENDLEETLERARDAGCDLVHHRHAAWPQHRSAGRGRSRGPGADPVHARKSRSFEGLPRTARLARTTGKPAVVVPNFVQPISRSEEEAIRGVAEAQGLPTARRSRCTASTCIATAVCRD